MSLPKLYELTKVILKQVINEGILDSILPYLVGYKKPSKTTSVYTPIIKKSNNESDVKKPASFGGISIFYLFK